MMECSVCHKELNILFFHKDNKFYCIKDFPKTELRGEYKKSIRPSMRPKGEFKLEIIE